MPVINTAMTYLEMRKLEKAEYYINATIKLDSSKVRIDIYNRLAEGWYFVKEYQRSIEVFIHMLSIAPNTTENWYYNLACLQSLLNENLETALVYLEKAIKLGFDFDTIIKDPDLQNLRQTPEFALLIEKYFPNKD